MIIRVWSNGRITRTISASGWKTLMPGCATSRTLRAAKPQPVLMQMPPYHDGHAATVNDEGGYRIVTVDAQLGGAKTLMVRDMIKDFLQFHDERCPADVCYRVRRPGGQQGDVLVPAELLALSQRQEGVLPTGVSTDRGMRRQRAALPRQEVCGRNAAVQHRRQPDTAAGAGTGQP